ncbi:PAS domain-containing protein [Streptomyces sp. NPDC049954]|uniref:PAS domain-containing protein n=1 Tax=Streptomyces sp. NPDC049954 TaxID=3155779 RepID=UPI00341E5781
MSASRRSGTTDEPDAQEPEHDDSDLLAALLDGMDAALCALDADGVITHWNKEAERILGWSAEEAVGRAGFGGWAARGADAPDMQVRLLAAMRSPGRQVHEFALLTKEGGRVLVRTQTAAVRDADGRPAGVYCAFSEVHTQIDLERSIALSEALFEDVGWGVVLVDADLRPALVNAYAAKALGTGRTALLGRPLGDLLDQGVEELESVLAHVLAEGPPPAPSEVWVSLREHVGEGAGPGRDGRRCWRSGFVRLSSPLSEEPSPLGVGWFFQDVTEARIAEQDASQLRFRAGQLHRAARAAAECEDPGEAVTVHLDFALAGFADHALVDLLRDPVPDHAAPDEAEPEVRLVRAAVTPAGPQGPLRSALSGAGVPLRYPDQHPAVQSVQRAGTVRVTWGGRGGPRAREWAAARRWPEDTTHALCAVLRSRGTTLGVLTFLRGPGRQPFERPDTLYAESVALRVASAVDLARLTGRD